MFKKLVNRVRPQEEKAPSPRRPPEPSSSRSRQPPLRTTTTTIDEPPLPERRSTRRSPRIVVPSSNKVTKRRSNSKLRSSSHDDHERPRPPLESTNTTTSQHHARLTTVVEDGNRPAEHRKNRNHPEHDIPIPIRTRKRSSSRKARERSPDDELARLREENAVLRARIERWDERGLSPAGKRSVSGPVTRSASRQRSVERSGRNVEELTHQLTALRESLKLEKARTKEAERNHKTLLKQVQLASPSPTTTPQSSLAPLHDDAFFKDSVQELRYQVHNWVKNLKWEVPNRPSQRRASQFVVPTVYRFLRGTCVEYQMYLGSRREVEVLMRAYLWGFLRREVFTKGRCLWGGGWRGGDGEGEGDEDGEDEEGGEGGSGDEVSRNPFAALSALLQTHLPPTHTPTLHTWRATTARLLAQLPSALMDANIASAVTKLRSQLMADLKHIHSGDAHLRSLEKVLTAAVGLDLVVMQEAVPYSFWPGGIDGGDQVVFDGERFNLPEGIEDEDEMDEEVVRLVVEPGFGWVGGYEVGEREVWLLKGEVEV